MKRAYLCQSQTVLRSFAVHWSTSAWETTGPSRQGNTPLGAKEWLYRILLQPCFPRSKVILSCECQSPGYCVSPNANTVPLAPTYSAFPHFPHKTRISTADYLLEPLASPKIASSIQLNGRVIFQKERVDKGFLGAWQRNLPDGRETERLRVNREALTANITAEEYGECRGRLHSSEEYERCGWRSHPSEVYGRRGWPLAISGQFRSDN